MCVCVYIYISGLTYSEMGVLGPTGMDRLSGAELASLAWAHGTACPGTGIYLYVYTYIYIGIYRYTYRLDR